MLRRATSLFVRHACVALAGAIAIVDGFAGCVEGFPRNSGRIVNPRLLGFGVAARGFALLDDRAAGFAQSGINLIEFGFVCDLDAEMIEAGLPAAGRDCKVHARIVEHPFGVIWLHDGRLRVEQSGIESN